MLPRAMPPKQRRDVRRWIYGALDLLFAAIYAGVFVFLIPNRLPLAAVHLWSLPVLALAMAAGTLAGGRTGWRVAAVAAALLLVDVVWLLVRIVVSAAFLSGVYGGFGKAAATFSLLAAALVIEAVALLPLFQLKFLMTRAGRRALGVSVAVATPRAAERAA
jgi:hypothetical protein